MVANNNSDDLPLRGEELQIQGVEFVGEQDGPPERELKEQLTQLFLGQRTVRTAYLAQVRYSDGTDAVALCIRADSESIGTTVESVGRIFREMFGPHEHLDIIALDRVKEAELSRHCTAFFSR